MDCRARVFDDQIASGPLAKFAGELIIIFVLVITVLAVIGFLYVHIRERKDRSNYLDSLPESGYEMKIFKMRDDSWGWSVQTKQGGKIEFMNLPSYWFPHSRAHHASEESARTEAMGYLKSCGFSPGQDIKF